MPRSVRWALLLAIALCCASCGDNDASAPSAPSATIRKWERFDSTLSRRVDESNPFDPNAIAVDAEFLSPAGVTIIMPAFVTRDYTRSLVGGYEKLHATNELRWQVRFTPTSEGRWLWHW